MEDVMQPIMQKTFSFDAGYATAEEEWAAMHQGFLQRTESFVQKISARFPLPAGGQRGMEATAFPAGGQRGEEATAAEIERDLHISKAHFRCVLPCTCMSKCVCTVKVVVHIAV